jgi:hypothetical protein
VPDTAPMARPASAPRAFLLLISEPSCIMRFMARDFALLAEATLELPALSAGKTQNAAAELTHSAKMQVLIILDALIDELFLRRDSDSE